MVFDTFNQQQLPESDLSWPQILQEFSSTRAGPTAASNSVLLGDECCGKSSLQLPESDLSWPQLLQEFSSTRAGPTAASNSVVLLGDECCGKSSLSSVLLDTPVVGDHQIGDASFSILNSPNEEEEKAEDEQLFLARLYRMAKGTVKRELDEIDT